MSRKFRGIEGNYPLLCANTHTVVRTVNYRGAYEFITYSKYNNSDTDITDDCDCNHGCGVYYSSGCRFMFAISLSVFYACIQRFEKEKSLNRRLH